MKTFRYELGHVAKLTMTVGELKSKLSEYPDYMPVFGTWEGVFGNVRADSFGTQYYDSGLAEDGCECLVINVEDY